MIAISAERVTREDELSESKQVIALNDFERHTLASLKTRIAGLVYVASLRDYNTGLYHHDGLAALYGAEVAGSALNDCHKSLFASVVTMPASELLRDFSDFIEESEADAEKVLESWQTLKAYQTLIPIDSDQVSIELFISKMNITLIALRLRRVRKTEAEKASAVPFSTSEAE